MSNSQAPIHIALDNNRNGLSEHEGASVSYHFLIKCLLHYNRSPGLFRNAGEQLKS